MSFKPQTVLITGGGTGIGLGLAAALHARGSKVIIAGRRREVLETTCRAYPGMISCLLDVTDSTSIAAARDRLTASHPELDCVINNAGMQRMHDLTTALPLDYANDEVASNLVGLMAMCAAFVPVLARQRAASLINISSGLAFVPLAAMPVYCATKAAVRSFTISLRHQLKATSVKVIDLAPPAVQTDLHDYMGEKGKSIGIPLADFVRDALAGLDSGHDDFGVGTAQIRRQEMVAAGFDAAFVAQNAHRF